MDRCEHNQKIVKFCATESCAWRQTGGCQTCIKKYHNHIAHPIFLEEKDIENLLKKYKTEAFTKPKVKYLQESIHNYFSNMKVALISYIDQLDKKIRTDLYYPILIQQGTINMYKKLKKREYKKMNQRQFRLFYENTSKLTTQQINNQERKIYRQFSVKYSKMFNDISNIFVKLEAELKNIQTTMSFKIDGNYTQKVQGLFQEINKEMDEEKCGSENNKKDIIQSNKNGQLDPNKQKSVNQKQEIKFVINQPILNQPTIKKQDQSNAIRKQDQLTKMKKILLNMMDIDERDQKQNRGLSPFQAKVQQIRAKSKQRTQQKDTKSKSKGTNNNQTSFPNSNTKNNYLDVPTNELYPPLEKRNGTNDQSKSLSGNSSLSINFGDSMFKGQTTQQQQFNQKHNQLPSQTSQSSQRDSNIDQTNKNKLRAIVIPVRGQFKIDSGENSPILKKKREIQNLNLKVQVVYEDEIAELQNTEKPTLNENQQKSIALLKQSLQRKAQEAIPILQKCLELAPNNLSAAEYLSFLLLETGKPLQCLKVCNNILQLLEGEVIYDINSLHIHNNKAVSLIQLGRFSQSIPLLQKCIEVKQMDIFYKNLGDAYYLIGIYEKSIYNYRKSIVLNSRNSQQFYNLAVCLYAQQNYPEALTNIDRALKLDPKREDYIQLADHIRDRI